MQRKPWFMIAVIFVILVPLEVAAAFLAHHTMGEVMRSFYFLLLAANLGFIALCAAKPKLGVTLALLWALLIVPYQGLLATRLWRAQREAERVVTWAYERRLVEGVFPEDLSAYAPRDAGIMPRVYLYEQRSGGEGFRLYWSPLDVPSTSYGYMSDVGWTREVD